MMNQTLALSKIKEFFQFKSFTNIPKHYQESFFNSLPEDVDDLIERSFLQYKCQAFFGNRIANTCLNVFGCLGLPILLVIAFIRKRPNSERSVDAIIDTLQWGNGCLQCSLERDYPNRIETDWNTKLYLSFNDLFFILSILKKFPFAGLMLFKTTYKLSAYSYLISKYNPKAIIVHNEYSFTSSILTQYCRNKGIRHINFQHGERMWEIVCAYSTYDKFYLWDENYMSLFRKLRVKSEFFIEKPRDIIFKRNNPYNTEQVIDYIYYLANTDEELLCKIKTYMLKLCRYGQIWKVRLHPRYSDRNLVEKIIGKEYIEDYNISIEQSVLSARYIVSEFSTVLYQGYINGKEVIIDDLSNPHIFEILKDFEYVMLDKPHSRLSSII